MAKFSYTYTGDEPRDFPTIGLRDVQKGDTVESDEPLYSSFLVETTPTETNQKGE
jgi:hypothetical protein